MKVEFRQGDVARMPFDAESFDLVVCQAAFKNFALPGRALAEMYRVLRAGGTAVIQDMSRDASHADIEHEVDGDGASDGSARSRRRRRSRCSSAAPTRPGQFARLAAESPFRTSAITTARNRPRGPLDEGEGKADGHAS